MTHMVIDTNILKEKLFNNSLVISSQVPMEHWENSVDGKLQFTTNVNEFVQNGLEIPVNSFTIREAKYYSDMVFLYDTNNSTTINKEKLNTEGQSTLRDANNTAIVVGFDKDPMSKITLLATAAKFKEDNIDVPILLLNRRTGQFSNYEPNLDEISALLNFVKDEKIKAINNLNNKPHNELLDNFKEFTKSLGYPLDYYNDITQDITPELLSNNKNNLLTHTTTNSLTEPKLTDQSIQYSYPSNQLLDEFQNGGLLARTRNYSNKYSGYFKGLINTEEVEKELGFLNSNKSKAQSTTMLSPLEHSELFGSEVGLLYLKDQSTVRQMFNDPVGTWVDRANFGNKIGSVIEPLPIISHKDFLQQFHESTNKPRTNEIMSNLFPEGLVGTILDINSVKHPKLAKLELLALTYYASEKQGKNLIPTILNKGKLEIYEPDSQEISNLLNYAQAIYGLPLQKIAQSIGYFIGSHADLNKPITPDDIMPIEKKPILQPQEQVIVKSGINNKENDITEVVTDMLDKITNEAVRSIDDSMNKPTLINKDSGMNASVQNHDKIGQYKPATDQLDVQNTENTAKKWISLTPEEQNEKNLLDKMISEKAKKVWEEHTVQEGNQKIPLAPVIKENLTYKPHYYQPKKKTSKSQKNRS